MKISVIDAGNFKLDGGAMFGVVPKTIWQKMVPADENNLCSWKMRCLLVEDNNRLVLIDTGMGDKQAQKWQNFYFRHGDGELIKSIRDAGYHENEITDVLLSHLHFDHCGGAVCWNSTNDAFRLTFPNAKYWTHSLHWNSAMRPNPREKATFLSENLQPILESGQLNFIDQIQNPLGNKFEFIYADGHTEKMIMPIISYNNQKIIFAADTIPSFAHIHVPYCMSYDVRPLQTMEEKSLLLDKIVKESILLFFDHDVVNEAAEIEITERGYKAKNLGKLYEFI
jgi:glyoxylase-like metal-dependent hydrolase (beta-lactamase superfamily II)